MTTETILRPAKVFLLKSTNIVVMDTALYDIYTDMMAYC